MSDGQFVSFKEGAKNTVREGGRYPFWSFATFFVYNFTWKFIWKKIFQKAHMENTHKNSSKATTTASSKATTTAASPVYEVIPPLLRASVISLERPSCHHSFVPVDR